MSESSSSAEVDFLDLCENNVRSIQALVLANGENLLNHRQCGDLSSKLSRTTPNIRELVFCCGTSVGLFRPALESLYRYLYKAEVLVSQCAEEDWCAAAVFQCENENAFREILLDVGFCYNAMYELAKSRSDGWNDRPDDLRQSAAFKPASGSDVDGDRQDLQRRLDDLANGYSNMKGWESWMPWKVAQKRSLARYLLRKMCYTVSESQANSLDRYDAILWSKASEPRGTWGYSYYLGGGATEGGVCRTEWLGVRCAKKVFHAREYENFFLREAGILAHLKHPSIISFVCCGSGQKKGDRFIAMELMEMSLLDLIEEQKQKGVHFAVLVAVDMMVQIARGMCYSHGRGVAHRDLKPQNVVVSRLSTPHLSDGFCVKLVDFGESKIKVEVSRSNTMTVGGIGTTSYRAPEAHPQALSDGGRKVNWLKADAFSFAMTCAHLLSLEVPFGGTSRTDLYKEVTKEGQRPKVPDMYPRDLVTLVEECWRTNPRLRPSFVEICARLETFRHRCLRGYTLSSEGSQEDEVDCRVGDDYIKLIVEVKSSVESPLDEEQQDEMFDLQMPVLPCSRGHALEHQPQFPGHFCDMCCEDIRGDCYRCELCDFDAHPDCVEVRDKMEVFFHGHPIYLLVRNYYQENLEARCYMCKELLQHSEWTYRCERCDLDVHALCARYPREIEPGFVHPESLTLREYLPEQSLDCKCCNGQVRTNTWSYTCTSKRCPFDLHPHCTTLPWKVRCIFDASHWLYKVEDQRGFHCSRCGAPGFSLFYHCEDCDVDIHLDCLHDMEEVEDDWNGACERFMVEYATEDDHGKVKMISDLVEKLLGGVALQASLSSTASPPPVTMQKFLGKFPGGDALQASSSSTSSSPAGSMRKQATIRRLASFEKLSLDAFDDVEVRRKIVAETAERKAKRLAAKKETSTLKARAALEMFGKLEKMVQDMQRSKSMSQGDAEVLDSTLKMLEKRRYIVEEEVATQVQSKMRHGPRTCLFFRDNEKRGVYEVLASLAADTEDVWVMFLCEEPGQQHYMPYTDCLSFDGKLGEGRSEILQPLLASGLEVVTRAMSTLEGQLPLLDRVTLPNLGPVEWDLRAIDVEKHGKPLEETKNVEELKRADEWILDPLEGLGERIFWYRGLLRVRYKETEDGDSPGYTRGSLAWLCADHFNCGLKSGILQSYPLKYDNPELN